MCVCVWGGGGYVDTIKYSDEYDEANDDSMDTQQLFYDANIPEEVL